MEIFHSKNYNNIAKKIQEFLEPNFTINKTELPLKDEIKPDAANILIANPSDASTFKNLMDNYHPTEEFVMIDLWDEQLLGNTSPDFYSENPLMIRKSIVSDIDLTKPAPKINTVVSGVGNAINNILGSPIEDILKFPRIFYLGQSMPGLQTNWYKNLLLSYNPNLSYMRELSVELTRLYETSNDSITPIKNLLQNELTIINKSLDNIDASNISEKLEIIDENIRNIKTTINNTELIKMLQFSGIKNAESKFLDTVTEFHAKFCATVDAVAVNQFLWKRGKHSLKKFKRKFFVGTKGFKEMKRIYKTHYKSEKQQLKGDHLQMQRAISERFTEYYTMISLLSDILALQHDLINNLEIMHPFINGLQKSFNQEDQILHKIWNIIIEWTKPMSETTPTDNAKYMAAKAQITGDLKILTPLIDRFNAFVIWYNDTKTKLKGIDADIMTIYTQTNKILGKLQTDLIFIHLMNNLVTLVGMSSIAGNKTVSRKDIKKATKRFTLVWLEQMEQLLKTTSNKEKIDKGFMQTWNIVMEFAKAHSKNLRRERIFRIFLFSIIGVLIAFVAVGIDWSTFFKGLRNMNNTPDNNFMEFFSLLWDAFKGIPAHLNQLISG